MEFIQVTDPSVMVEELVYAVDLTVGQKLKIEVGLEDEVDLTVPVGKGWAIRVHIIKTITDA